jgi:hypothetical protein
MTIPTLKSISAAELTEIEIPRPEPILEPILATKSLALLYGPRGLGKTYVALGIAWAAAAGAAFLGWRAPRAHKVLYIDGEMATADMKQRLALFGPPPPTLEFMLADLGAASLPDLGTWDGQNRLMASWGHPELVVLDNLSSLAGFKSGDPDSWGNLQRFLLLQRRFGRAVLLVHHANKKGLQRGGNAKEDVLDIVMSLRRPGGYQPREGARLEIHFEKARGLYGAAIDPIEARLVADEAGRAYWRWRKAHIGKLDRAAALLNGGMAVTAMGVQLGVSRATSYRLRARARRNGLLVNRPEAAP